MNFEKMDDINYPYLPEGKKILYVDASNHFMIRARAFAKENSLDRIVPDAAVIVLDGKEIGIGANGSVYHFTNVCMRVKRGIATGESYELCEGCHPKNHGEPSAIADAHAKGNNTQGADLYLWGHWWCCEPCWDVMDEAGIKNVYLLEGSEILFNKKHKDSIIGKQFDE